MRKFSVVAKQRVNRKPAPLPEIAPCPCPKRCKVVIMQTMPGTWRVVSDCGFAGPHRFTPRTAREAWNRRASDTADREALMREGAMAAVDWLRENTSGFGLELSCCARAIDHGEVIPKAGKPEPDVMTQKRCGQGKSAPEGKQCPYLRKDGQCRTFRCTNCEHSYPWCQGSDDDRPNWCDHCKVSEDKAKSGKRGGRKP